MSRRDSMLREMGIAPLWRDRASPPPQAGPDIRACEQAPVEPPAAAPVRADSAPLRPVAPVVTTVAAPPATVSVEGLGWDELEERIRACQACRLSERRTQAVPGVGDREADWLFVGEGPGAEEDARGEPFVGQAGKLLDAMLASLGLARGQNVYIANAVKCRPPGNRTPEADEIATCHPYLDRQIELIRPRIIVALGRPAAQTLLGGEIKIAAARGHLFERKGVPVVVTYHPAYLLRNPQDKAKAWEDLCFARASVV
ncbi:uracil-DNA glycosylase [Methyloversatilis discipulorum]|uniref:uracil-DNA glycosylase n=1 Tax=Methyloversatilis discipulorum TaxID=1119528 RepID=UPI001A5EB224|nr:uracil-DNA glycosylase [Methyloversatilis discipulorum]MBL8466367.1 uracil-DNA glycosylase [Methyloversatilis discipulorum]